MGDGVEMLYSWQGWVMGHAAPSMVELRQIKGSSLFSPPPYWPPGSRQLIQRQNWAKTWLRCFMPWSLAPVFQPILTTEGNVPLHRAWLGCSSPGWRAEPQSFHHKFEVGIKNPTCSRAKSLKK